MRFIIHEMAYEKPIASGLWQYAFNGQPSGTVEHWRMTEALAGYRFLRVDLDARQAKSGRTYLYHLVIDENGRPVQLKFRVWQGDLEIIGNVLIENDALIVTRETKDQRFEDVLNPPEDFAFWFPASTSLGYMAGSLENEPQFGFTLRTNSERTETLMAPVITKMTINQGAFEEIKIMNKMRQLRPTNISWEDNRRLIWLDAEKKAWQMVRDDGLTAVETRHLHYQRITTPGPTQQPNSA